MSYLKDYLIYKRKELMYHLRKRKAIQEELKKINFVLPNENPKRTVEQLQDAKKRAYFFDKLADIKDGKLTYTELADFLGFILQESVPDKNPMLSFRSKYFGGNSNTNARFVPFLETGSGVVEFSSERIYECAKGNKNFLELLSDLGHERHHYFQYLAKKNMKKFSEKKLSQVDEKTRQIIESLDFNELEWVDVSNMLGLIKDDLGENFVEKYNKMTDKEKLGFKNAIASSNYVQSKAEEDARAGGFEFAKQFVDVVMRDEMCDSHLKKWLRGQFKIFDDLVQQEKENREHYELYNEFQELVSKIPFDRIAEIGEDIERKAKQLRFFSDGRDDIERRVQFDMLSRNTYNNIVSIYFAGKSTEELIDSFCLAVKNNYTKLGNAIVGLINKRSLFEKGNKDVLSEKIEEIFSTQELTTDTVSFGELLRPEKAIKMIGKFLKEGKIKFAIYLCMMSDSAVFKHIAYSSVYKAGEEMVKRFEMGDRDMVLGDFFELREMVKMYNYDFSTNKKLGISGDPILYKRGEKLLKAIEKNKESITKEENANVKQQDEMIEKIYGKKELEYMNKIQEHYAEMERFVNKKQSSPQDQKVELLKLPQ